MSGRERTILLTTLTVIGLALLYHFVLADLLEEALAGGVGDLELERERFREYAETIKAGDQIREEYGRIASLGPERGGDPSQAFQVQMFELLTSQLKVPNPRISPPRPEKIPDVNDFVFVQLEIDVSGTYQEMAKLLVDLDNLGLLIKTVELKRERGQRRDEIAMMVEVQRLIKANDAMRSRRRY